MELIETSKLMRTQSNRSTQYPLFIIQEEQEVVKAEGCGGEYRYLTDDCESSLTAEQYDAIEEAQDNENSESVAELVEELGFESLYDINLRDYRKIEYDLEYVYCDNAGVFFTEQACHDHIESNRHHYTKPRSYVISAWRNYEMQEVMRMILKLTGDDIPSCYQ